MSTIKPAIFKAYDIRGVYPDEINENAAYLVGRALVTFLKCQTVVVGRDMRASSPKLAEALIKGLQDQGAQVTDLGLVTTPMLSFAVMTWNQEAGIMVSASHNPAQYNGLKLIRNSHPCAFQLYDENGIKEINELVLANDWATPTQAGKCQIKNIQPEYQQYLLAQAKNINGLKIVVDYGNGVGSVGANPVFQSLPIEVISLFAEPDGTFPNHEPNPHDIENLIPLQERVVAEKADLGIFFDGDADRSFFIDEKGATLFPDVLLGILSLEELAKHPGAKIFHDLRCSKAVAEAIAQKGGTPVMMRVGNPFYKEALMDPESLMAAELSGHMMFREYFAIDDGLFSALKFMSLLSASGQTASQLAAPFKKYFQTEEINLQVADPDLILENVKHKYADGKLITIDGVLIDFPDWWLSLRKSNTEPIIRLRIEAKNENLLAEKRQEVLALIEAVK